MVLRLSKSALGLPRPSGVTKQSAAPPHPSLEKFFMLPPLSLVTFIKNGAFERKSPQGFSNYYTLSFFIAFKARQD